MNNEDGALKNMKRQVGNRILLLQKMSHNNYSQQSQEQITDYLYVMTDEEAEEEALKVMDLVDKYTDREVICLLTEKQESKLELGSDIYE